MDLVWELLELTIFETRCFCSSCRNYCLKRCRCSPMTTELACRKWWTFLTFFSGYLMREFNFPYTGAIRRSDMLHRKWHERPIRSAWSRYSIRRAIHPVKTSHLQARFAWRIRIRQRAAGEAKLKRLLRVVERASEHPRFGARQEFHPRLHWHELVPVRQLRPAGATRADPVLSSADASRPPDG
jgi:hypothetical protein